MTTQDVLGLLIEVLGTEKLKEAANAYAKTGAAAKAAQKDVYDFADSYEVVERETDQATAAVDRFKTAATMTAEQAAIAAMKIKTSYEGVDVSPTNSAFNVQQIAAQSASKVGAASRQAAEDAALAALRIDTSMMQAAGTAAQLGGTMSRSGSFGRGMLQASFVVQAERETKRQKDFAEATNEAADETARPKKLQGPPIDERKSAIEPAVKEVGYDRAINDSKAALIRRGETFGEAADQAEEPRKEAEAGDAARAIAQGAARFRKNSFGVGGTVFRTRPNQPPMTGAGGGIHGGIGGGGRGGVSRGGTIFVPGGGEMPLGQRPFVGAGPALAPVGMPNPMMGKGDNTAKGRRLRRMAEAAPKKQADKERREDERDRREFRAAFNTGNTRMPARRIVSDNEGNLVDLNGQLTGPAGRANARAWENDHPAAQAPPWMRGSGRPQRFPAVSRQPGGPAPGAQAALGLNGQTLGAVSGTQGAVSNLQAIVMGLQNRLGNVEARNAALERANRQLAENQQNMGRNG